MLYATPSQTVGPYLRIALETLSGEQLAGEDVAGERVTIEGRVVDGNGRPVPDGLVEIWQANSYGRYNHPEDARDLPLDAGFTGFGRLPTDAEGRYRFRTVKPGRVPGRDGALQAPHILVSVFARGILKRMATRIYFPDEPSNAEDQLLSLVAAERRGTLIATKSGEQPATYRFDVVLQGDWLGQGETVFLDI